MTTDSRTEILRRIRQALDGTTDGTPPDPATIPRDYLTVHAHRTPEQSADLLADNLTDYRAHVHRTNEQDLPATLARLLTHHGTRTAITPPDLPHHWLSQTTGITITTPDETTTTHTLDTADTVITGCTLAIAETGTIILDSTTAQGQRRITLIPDHHICVIRTPQQIVDSIPQALPRLNPAHPQTWISGPSATSDIELTRIEGVHGPRTLDVILLTSSPQSG
ncbi:LutC/YkgG family protein [Streptomyces sp. NBC_01477]|uniref:LutC/YkgG family protein n=1 Tax=Streptomyces sp. NBC_01477 TaxID=2976015 RepID=UPI002E33CD18|nr:LUD domain-containing protein [Streptomyces sp. NBC_01477]